MFIKRVTKDDPEWKDNYGSPAWNKNAPIVPVNPGPYTSMLNYPQGVWIGGAQRVREFQWGLVMPFESKMKVVRTEQGRSRWNVIVEAETGELFPITIDDLMYLIHNDNFYSGWTSLKWNWFARKQGANYLLKLLENN